MVARAREIDESFEDYRDNLKVEAYDLKLRLRLGPSRWQAFKAYLATRTINIDEEKDAEPNTDASNKRDIKGQTRYTRRLQDPVRNNLPTQGHDRLGHKKKSYDISKGSS